MSVWRGANSHWLITRSGDGQLQTNSWGASYAPYNDVTASGDYDGDGKTDLAVFRRGNAQAGHWYIKRSSDGQIDDRHWGLGTDVPVAGDYDGDGKTDVAVFRRGIQGQQGGYWFIKLSSDGQIISKLWGVGTDVPVASDYDGDGKTDIAVWRGSDTNWYIVRSSNNAVQTVSWGAAAFGDVPVTGDYDGDGKADVAVWRESTGFGTSSAAVTIQ